MKNSYIQDYINNFFKFKIKKKKNCCPWPAGVVGWLEPLSTCLESSDQNI